ncbi:MAG: hypothetical protein WCF67_23970 [Chitinophagaceae bacterium]
MKLINRTIAVKGLLLAGLFAVLSSFSVNWGGDSYQVFVNNKLVLEQHVAMKGAVKSIQLDAQSTNDQVSVYYSHCGQVGKSRNITIRDDKNKVLKELSFADGTGKAMNFKTKDVLGVQKNADKLNLYYASKEIPEGKLLVSIVISKGNVGTP